MSGLSSPTSLITANAQSTAINVYSIAKIGIGLTGLLLPAFATTTSTPFKYAARGQLKASKPTANTVNPAPGHPAEGSLAIRLVAARDVALGLLLRDTTAAVVVRALQADAFVSLLELLSVGAGYLEGSLSKETAISVAGFSASFAAFALYILNY
ncbi:chloride channel proteink [Rhodotorula toruloides]|uniref:Chloride channel proteink n=1 Tax=Rhodotorula toruloides TaxID=5286 RepID=A0A511KGS0_RHOTO|nr:chloride channel proteink [Rhodotorula toruloides]